MAAGWHERCVICGCTSLRALARYQHAHLVRCAACRMVFAARIASETELQDHYEDYGHAWQDSPITRERYRNLLDDFETERSTYRILDFGCGAGYFLEEARARGWETFGIEYSGLALEMARSKQLEVVAAPVGRDAFPEGYFDVVTAFEVFEHIADPSSVADVLAHVLRRDGLLYCTTPNFDALSRRLLGPRWNVIGYPEHLCYFTPMTLRGWLARHGFAAESVGSTGISVSRLRGESPSTAAGSADPSADEQLREAIERSRVLALGKTTANEMLSILGLGDTLKARLRLRAPSPNLHVSP